MSKPRQNIPPGTAKLDKRRLALDLLADEYLLTVLHDPLLMMSNNEDTEESQHEQTDVPLKTALS